MTGQEPQITARQDIFANQWVTIVRKDVVSNGVTHDYYAVGSPDFVIVAARTPSGRISVVRQFRPALERFTLELPAGTIDPLERCEDTCRRELLEEAGLEILSLSKVGSYFADSGRMSNQHHVFFAETSEQLPGFLPEPGVQAHLMTPEEVRVLVRSGQIDNAIHISALYVCGLL